MENTTTIRLEINGEPAKNTLEALRQRAEQLADAISKVKSKELRVESGEANPLGTSATPPIATQQRENINLTEQQLRDLKRLEQEYASVTAENER